MDNCKLFHYRLLCVEMRLKIPFSDMDWERMFNLLDEVVADLISVERTYRDWLT